MWGFCTSAAGDTELRPRATVIAEAIQKISGFERLTEAHPPTSLMTKLAADNQL